MRICFVTSTFFPLIGGLEMVVHNLATAHSMRGHKVFLVTPYPNHRNYIDNYKYRVIRFGFKGYGRLNLVKTSAVLTLAYVCKFYKIDVINVHNVFTPGTWTHYYRKFDKTIPVVGTPHGDDIQTVPEINFGVRLEPQKDQIVRRNLTSFKRITAVSPSMRKELYKLGIDKYKIDDVPNGVWINNSIMELNSKEIKNKYDITLNTTCVISIGRNHVVKGYEYGLNAIAQLKKSGMNITYIIVGRDIEPLKKKVEELSISHCVVMPGQVEASEVFRLLAISDIYLSTSLSESFGLTTLEAMSACLPCIVTDVAGSRDLLNSECAFFVKPKDSEQISYAIKVLADNPKTCQKMGLNSYKLAQKYDWLNVAKMYEAVYKNAIG